MDLLRSLTTRLAPGRPEVAGIAVAVLGSVVATVLALRVVAWPDAVPAPALQASTVVVASPSPAPVLVHVVGAVHEPGVVTLATGARVADAVAAAGGPTAAARLGSLNLARAVVDGEQVVVPDADTVDARVGAAAPRALRDDGRLDLNLATADELESLPGIGEVTAARIVAHREEQGPFTATAQLREVRGIGEATWTDVRDLVAVGP